MSHVVFVTLFLGLVSGVQPVELRVDQNVRSVRLLLGGHELAVLRGAPWQASLDLGMLEPKELVAVAYDDRGEEIDRTAQILNLPRHVAEVEILVHNDDHGLPKFVELVARHLQFLKSSTAAVRLDGVPLRVNGLTAPLPTLDWTRSHVISAELRFVDGSLARGEIVVNGGFSDSTGAQLSPVVITGGPETVTKLDGCFSADGIALHASAVEKNDALVLFVREPDPRRFESVVRKMEVQQRFSPLVRQMMTRDTTLDADVIERMVWPIAQHFSSRNGGTSILFEHSNDIPAAKGGMLRLLALPMWKAPLEQTPRQFADAVAVAALQTLTPARRRAVVLIASNVPDRSAHSPEQVRHYLQSIHVPLFVWSLTGPRLDLAETWGEVEDISHSDALREAVSRLRQVVSGQRIAWVATDALTALRARADPSCGFSTLAGTK